MKLMKTTPARSPSTSIRHAWPPGPPPRPRVPFTEIRLMSSGATGFLFADGLSTFGFGVGRVGRRRFAGLGFLAMLCSQPLYQTRIGFTPKLGREKAWRKGDHDVFQSIEKTM